MSPQFRSVTWMRILVCNDDGIYSPGLAALAEVAAEFGEVRVVAPDVEQSAMGQAITSTRPLSYRRTSLAKFEAFRVNGTPSDCVAVGIFNWERVDLVLSGINLGENLGSAIWHSGTVAAAKQAVLLGLRGIAVSTPANEGGPDFEAIKPWVRRALQTLMDLPDLSLVNVNIPTQPRAMHWTRQSVRRYDGTVVPGVDPMGRHHFWSTVVPIVEVEEGTDRWAMKENLVSLTPLRLDLTDEKALAEMQRRGAVQ
jgi:5'/3'-nucleotidase